MISTEMGATDLASVVTPALAEGEAFFELGMKYASGRLGPADLVTAHKWFNVAVARGCRTAAHLRSELAREMSAQEIAAAQREARLFLTRH
jgi:TPR repeat protein